MTELIFVEGVSGVGKSTMVRMLAEELRALGYAVKEYVEFDYTNPIDFYCTAYLSLDEYEEICAKYQSAVNIIHKNTIFAGDVRLIRYYDEDTPLFGEPLLSELEQKEFCYNPSRLVSLKEYTTAYVNVWNNFAVGVDGTYDFIIFDGSLLHHPINDMMRNYKITGEQAIAHVTALLDALGAVKHRIFYLKTNDIGEQLKKAHINRRQEMPTKKQISFWETRHQNDMIVLKSIEKKSQIYNVSDNSWDMAREQILQCLV